MASPEIIIASTIANHIREVEENIMRNRKLPAKMKAGGRMEFNCAGESMDWRVRFKRGTPHGWGDMETLSFSRLNRFKVATLDWRGFVQTEALTDLDMLKNKGQEAIINLGAQIGQNLVDDMEEYLGDLFFIDGNASGNEQLIHGFESWFSVSGPNASAPIGTPNDTYAGLATALGSYGGSWSGSWPTGTGSPEYDFWTPLIVDYTSAVATATGGWEATTKTWPNTCIEALRYGIIKSMKNKSAKAEMGMIMLNDELWRLFLNAYDPKERLQVMPGQKGSLYNLGFTDVINFDGKEVTTEYGIPATVGYGLAFEHLKFKSLQKNLFESKRDYNHAAMAHQYSVRCAGNLLANPRYQVKWDNVT